MNIQHSQRLIIKLCRIRVELIDRIRHYQIHPKNIVLLGDTKAGKTTLMYYLSGLKLLKQKDQKKDLIQMIPEKQYQKAFISSTSVSTTEFPNIFSSNDNQQQSYTIIDMPGFNDDRFLNRISNLFINEKFFNQLFQLERIHLIMVIQQGAIQISLLIKILKQFSQFLNIEQLREQQYFSVIFTKVPEQDKNQLKQKFFECLQQIRQQLATDQSQQQNLLSFIQYLIQLRQKQKQQKQEQRFIFTFTSSQPDLEEGKNLMNKILGRNQFFQNDKKQNKSILHQKYAISIFNNYLVDNNFNKNLFMLLQETEILLQQLLEFSFHLNYVFHNNFIQLFRSENQQQLQQNIQIITNKYFNLVNEINYQKQQNFNIVSFNNDFIECVKKTQNQKYLLKVDQVLFQIQKIVEINNKNEEVSQDSYKIEGLLSKIKKMYEFFMKFFQKNQLQQKNILTIAISQFNGVMDFLSTEFFRVLTQLDHKKINLKLIQIYRKLISTSQKLFNQTNYMTFKIKVNQRLQKYEFSQSDQSDNQSDQSTQNYQKNIKKMKSQFLKVKNQEQIKKIIESYGKKTTLKKTFNQNKRYEQLINSLQQNIKNYSPPNPNNLKQMVYTLINFRHYALLRSSLTNFLTYFQFILHHSAKSDENKYLYLQQWINTLCRILQSYSLYEQAIQFYLFAGLYKEAKIAFKAGVQLKTISQNFMRNKLIKNIWKLYKQNKLEILKDFIVKVYNYLIGRCFGFIIKKNQYQQQLLQKLKQIQQNQNGEQISSQNQYQINYFILHEMSMKKTLYKVQFMSNIIQNCQFTQFNRQLHQNNLLLTKNT